MKYIEQEMAKKKGKSVDVENNKQEEEEDELYKVPENLKVRVFLIQKICERITCDNGTLLAQ